jgi:hypothetical protein
MQFTFENDSILQKTLVKTNFIMANRMLISFLFFIGDLLSN